MMIYSRILFFISLIIVGSLLILQLFEDESNFEIFLDKSAPYIGAKDAIDAGFDGSGIKIALIDTGVDYNHPDLLGFGEDGKVIGGYDFVDNDKFPIDVNGHGTEVAGIIAADGQLVGVAPKSKILAYRVSENGESVSSNLIIRAIEQAMKDKADIINISLGVNLTNKKIDEAVNSAVNQGIVVVTAAGNHGPEPGSIGSPGVNPNTITVGATYNNITASIVSTLEIGDKAYQVLPMVGTNALDQPITSEIIFAKYGRERDFEDISAKDSIVLVERGSDMEDEIVYFSDKENNAANAGAKAIIVYNNQPGLFYGELTHEFTGPNYQPTIPAVSMSKGDGLALRDILSTKTVGTLNVFYHPDFVAFFSSRGPVSPFYIKPDLVAPGSFVNTTLSGGEYNFTSGTSFAAPHVTGAAALLLQKKGDLTPNEIKSILVTTSDSVSDPYGNSFDYDIAGSGRLNITKAINSKLIIEPTYLMFNLSPEKNTDSKLLPITSLDGNYDYDVSFVGNENIDFEYTKEEAGLTIHASLKKEIFDPVQDKVLIKQGDASYAVPIIVHISKGTIHIDEENGDMRFAILAPDEWSYAKISVLDKNNGIIDIRSATPSKNAQISVYEPGEYWIESKIRVNGETIDAYEIVSVDTVNEKGFEISRILQIPERPLLIVLAVVIIIAVAGYKFR